MGDTGTEDSRFSHIGRDPRFRRMPRRERKVKIDKRFEAMFKDKRFKMKYAVDKRGKPLHNYSTNEDLKQYYELSSSDENDDDDDNRGSDVINSDVDKMRKSQNSKKSDDNENLSKTSARGLVHPDKQGKKTKNLPAGKMQPRKFNDAIDSETGEKQSIKEHGQPVSNDDDDGSDISKSSSDESDEQEGGSDIDADFELKSENNGDSDAREDGDSDDDEDGDDDDAGYDVGDGTEDDEGSTRKTSMNNDMLKKVSSSIASSEASSRDKCRKDYLSQLPESENSDEESEEEFDPARGVGDIESSTSSDVSSEEDEKDVEFDHKWGELGNDAPEAEEITHRLAICNMDWDRIKAADLYVLLHSFVPVGGVLKSVKIYLSEFGKQRLKEETLSGPPELVDTRKSNREQDSDTNGANETEDNQYHRERLRQYQLNRLKYYYAVAECDSTNTANKIYEECDGMEYESSSARCDLRFIPNEMTFDEEAKSCCTQAPDLVSYKPSQFCTSALQQSKVELTWDETDKDRLAVTAKSFKKEDVADMDLKAYLASSSEDEEDMYSNIEPPDEASLNNEPEPYDDEEAIARYRELLKGAEDDDKEVDDSAMEMEITWEPGLREKADHVLQKKAMESVKLTPWEQFLHKKKEKKMKKKSDKIEANQQTTDETQAFSDDELPSDVNINEPFFKKENKKKEKKKNKKNMEHEKTAKDDTNQTELELLVLDEDDDKHHFNLKQIIEQQQPKKKKKKRKDNKTEVIKDDFQIDVDDPRFAAVFSSHHFNIDPSDPQFKNTTAMDKIISEKQKRRSKKDEAQHSKVPKLDIDTRKREPVPPELSQLVKSVKSKTKQHMLKKK